MSGADASGTGRPAIVSLGSINADFQMRIDRRPEVSETLIARDFVRLGGGKAANVAFLARRLGHDAVLIGRVGDDDLAEQALRPLREAGINLGNVARVDGQDTAVSIITVPPDGRKGIVLAAGANHEWRPEEAEDVQGAVAAAPGGSVLVVDCEVPGFIAEAAMRCARQRGMRTLLDPSPADSVGDDLLACCDVIMPNPTEAETLTGMAVTGTAEASRAARALLERGVGAACVKLPGGGCVVADGELRCLVSVHEGDVVDTTGAGDAFAGAMAVALIEGRDLVAATVFATAAATHAVVGYGSQPSYPDRGDIERISAKVATSTIPDE